MVVMVAAMVVAVVATSMKASSSVGGTIINKRSVHAPPWLTACPVLRQSGTGAGATQVSCGFSVLFASASRAGSTTTHQVMASPGSPHDILRSGPHAWTALSQTSSIFSCVSQ